MSNARRRGRFEALVILGSAFVLATAVGAAAQEDPTTTTTSSTTTTTTTQPTTTTTQPTTTTTQPTTTTRPTTTTTRPSTTTTQSTTTTTAATTTTTEADDDDDSNTGTWVAVGLLALVAIGAGAWLIATAMKRRSATNEWEARQTALLDDAQEAHDGAVDLVARWSSLPPEQLSPRWAHEMERLERLRSHLSRANAAAPQGPRRTAMQDVASAIDDLRIALGQTDLGSAQTAATAQIAYPPAAGPGAAADLQAAIRRARERTDPATGHGPGPSRHNGWQCSVPHEVLTGRANGCGWRGWALWLASQRAELAGFSHCRFSVPLRGGPSSAWAGLRGAACRRKGA